ncbi:MAG: hypothetical protein ABIF71_05770, partial [Planctomycetota bacterium]
MRSSFHVFHTAAILIMLGLAWAGMIPAQDQPAVPAPATVRDKAGIPAKQQKLVARLQVELTRLEAAEKELAAAVIGPLQDSAPAGLAGELATLRTMIGTHITALAVPVLLPRREEAARVADALQEVRRLLEETAESSDFLIPVGWTDGFPERVWRIFRVTNGLRRLSFLGSDFRMNGHAPDA